MTELRASNLTLSYGNERIIDQLDLQIPEGKVTVLIGPNGCGKSTLLKSMARLLTPTQGSVLLNGKNITQLPTNAVARQLALLPQGPTAPEGITVRELVKLGRYPHQRWLKTWSQEDQEMVEEALRATGMLELSHRDVDSLSGGQRQRAWIAMTLAQGTDLILLDEPTTYLDLAHQIEVLDLLDELNIRQQRTIVMVLHDINLACRYAHHIVAVHKKKVYAQGDPGEVINQELLMEVFGLECEILLDPYYGTPLCVPKGRTRELRKEAPPSAVTLAVSR